MRKPWAGWLGCGRPAAAVGQHGMAVSLSYVKTPLKVGCYGNTRCRGTWDALTAVRTKLPSQLQPRVVHAEGEGKAVSEMSLCLSS